MPNQITMPAGNTQTSQRKNALTHSATDTTAHTPNDKLQDELRKLKYELGVTQDNYYDDMTLSLERLKMLEAVINDVAHALSFVKDNTSKHLTEPLSTRLGIGQLLAMDFIQSLSDDIAELEGKA